MYISYILCAITRTNYCLYGTTLLLSNKQSRGHILLPACPIWGQNWPSYPSSLTPCTLTHWFSQLCNYISEVLLPKSQQFSRLKLGQGVDLSALKTEVTYVVWRQLCQGWHVTFWKEGTGHSTPHTDTATSAEVAWPTRFLVMNLVTTTCSPGFLGSFTRFV